MPSQQIVNRLATRVTSPCKYANNNDAFIPTLDPPQRYPDPNPNPKTQIKPVRILNSLLFINVAAYGSAQKSSCLRRRRYRCLHRLLLI